MEKGWSWSVLFFVAQAGYAQFAFEGQTEALGDEVNSSAHEHTPVLAPDGQTLYFTRSKHADNVGGIRDQGDIWYAERQADGSFSPAKNLGPPLNDTSTSSIMGFADQGQTMYLSYSFPEYGQRRLRIARSTRQGTGWSTPQEVAIPYFKNKSTRQSGWVSQEQDLMLLELESFESYGNEDIYVSFRTSDGTWSPLKNLKDPINTPYQEASPFLLEDKKTLVFASNGHNSVGSWDLYVSERLDESWTSWSSPRPLGGAVNTRGAELSFFLVPQARIAYFARTRNSEEYSHILRVAVKDSLYTPKPPPVAPVPTPAEPQETARPLVSLRLSLVDKKDGRPLHGQARFTGENGDSLYLLAGTETFIQLLPAAYRATFSSPGYWSIATDLDLQAADTQHQQRISLEALEEGTTLVLDHVLFERGTATLIPGAEGQLEQVRQMMEENPSFSLFISGHTDNKGDFNLNLQLSVTRVQAVIDYLVAHGMDKERLSGKGYGSTRSVASNKSEKGRRLNRRVTFTIVKDKKP